MQFTTVGREIWRGARQAQRLAEANASDPEVQERLRKLRLVKALRESKKSWKEIQDLVGISRATYHRWQKALKEKGLAGLKPRSRRPKHLRTKVHWTPGLLIRIETLRKENPTWGRWSIWLTLRKEGFQMSERTVGRILAYLEKHRRIESVAGYLARTQRGKLKRRVNRPYAKRKPRGYEARAPGDLVQVDTLTLTLGPGSMVKHFSAIDLHSRFVLAEVHSRATAKLSEGFLSLLLARAPFPIRAIQVDGGSEFMAEFEEACCALGIALFVLPPRSPKLNGHVERMQRTFKEEFYTRPLPTPLSELQAELDTYLDYYNRRRPHMALGGLAPLEFLAKMQEESVPQRVSNVLTDYTYLTPRAGWSRLSSFGKLTIGGLVPMSPSRKGDPLEMKRINRRAILEALKGSRSLTRAELARRLGLTKSTISSLMDQLVSEGLVLSRGDTLRPKSQLGRPGVEVGLNPAGAVALGAELGVENSVVLAVDWTGTLLFREEWGADPRTPLSERLERLTQVTRHALQRHPEALGLGLALPGVVDARGWLHYAPNLGWRDFSVAEALQARLPFPVHIENDANSSAAGEVFFTPRQGQLAYLMLGTGLGVGLVHAGTVLRGANGAFGEVGHWLGSSPKRCRCGRVSCLETEVSLRAMLEHYHALGGKAKDFWEVLKQAQTGHRLAVESLAELGRALGRLIANLAVAYDPERVVLGGAGAEAWDYLQQPLRQAVEEHAFLRQHQRLEVQPSLFGHLAPAMGAAALVLHSFLASGGLREHPASPVAMQGK